MNSETARPGETGDGVQSSLASRASGTGVVPPLRTRGPAGFRAGQTRGGTEVRRALAPIEFTFDLRETPPDKVLGRLFAALDRIAADVTLLVIVRDTPELAGVTANAAALLARGGYVSDTSRIPAGGQRIRIRTRNRPRDGDLSIIAPLETSEGLDEGPPVDPFGDGAV